VKEDQARRATDGGRNPRETLIRIPLDSKEKLEQLLAMEDRLEKSGLEIETGSWTEKSLREWSVEVGREESKRILQLLRAEGFRPEVARAKRPLRRGVRYAPGDVFRIRLTTGRFAYGRILVIEPPRPVFVEIYRIASKENPPMRDLARSEWLLRIHCADDGITGGAWKIIGHIPIVGPVKKPLFWDDSPFDGKFYVREDPVVALGQRETTLDEIRRLRAQPAVLASRQAMEIALGEVLVRGLKHEWVDPEESRNPVRKPENALR
jgi:hypothetical protein